MNKIIYTTVAIALSMNFLGCSHKSGEISTDKVKTLHHVKNVINQHKSDALHSAVALSIDEKNNYILGYAYEANSQQKAKLIAMKRCKNAHNKVHNLVQECKLYSVDNQDIRVLK